MKQAQKVAHISSSSEDFLPKVRIYVNTPDFSDSCGLGVLEFYQVKKKAESSLITNISDFDTTLNNVVLCVRKNRSDRITNYEQSNVEIYSQMLMTSSVTIDNCFLCYNLFSGFGFGYNIESRFKRKNDILESSQTEISFHPSRIFL